MDFIDEVASVDTRPSIICKVKVFIDNQDAEKLEQQGRDVIDQEKLERAKETHTLKSIHSILKIRGFTGSDEALSRHYKKECVCYLPRS